MTGNGNLAYESRSFDSCLSQEQVLDDWAQLYEQFDPGPFLGRFQSLDCGPIKLTHETMNRTLGAYVALPEGRFSICAVGGGTAAMRSSQGRIARGECLFTASTRENFAVMEADLDVFAIIGDTRDFGLDEYQSRRLGGSTGLMSAEWLALLFRRAERQDLSLELISLIPDLVHDQIGLWFERHEQLPARMAVSDKALWRDLCALVRSSGPSDLSVRHLSIVLARPVARLRQVCRDAIDRELDDILYATRLGRAHRMLLGPAPTTVTDTAMSCEFLHLSRFAQGYKSMFGELPSQTILRNRAQPVLPAH